MKKFELHMGIALIIITTILDVMFPFAIPFSKTNLALMCFMSAIGYVTAYLYIDSYLHRHELHHWTKGYNEGLEDAKEIRQYKY